MTYQELMNQGYSRDTLRTALRRKELVLLRRGVYAWSEPFHTGDRKYRALAHHVAIAKTSHQGALSHLSAALWWDAKILHLPHQVHISVTSNRNTHRKGVAVHKNRAEVLASAAIHEGLLVSSPLHTVIDCAKTLPLAEALCVADDFLHRRICALEELEQALNTQSGRGSVNCRKVATLMSTLADSPAETLARLHIHLFGFSQPTEQFRVVTASGRTYRADFAWEYEKIILEVDGEVKYSGIYGDPRDVVREERRRQKELEREGWKIVRVGWNEVYHAPHLLKKVLWEAGLQMR